MRPLLACALLAFAGPLAAQTAPSERGSQAEMSEVLDALLGTLMGSGVDASALQRDVAEVGGVPFRRDVPIAFLNREQLSGYLREVLDAEYPLEEARDDARQLAAFDLLAPGTDLRALRARVLEDNVAGFYDDRPDKRRLFAVSEQQTFTPMNQIVLAHELRHALQDQYTDLHALVSGAPGDFDDRSLAVLSLFEGDATLVMERFVRSRLGALGLGASDGEASGFGGDLGLGGAGAFDIPGAPPVVRDHLVQPYLTGLGLARAIWQRGGAEAMRAAWADPPASTEQVLHPQLYFERQAPRRVEPSVAGPPHARLLREGVLGEMLLRTLVGSGGEAAAEGWGGDGWRLWDVEGATALAWRAEWDSAKDAREFHDALRLRFAAAQRAGETVRGWERFDAATGWAFAIRFERDGSDLVSASDQRVLMAILEAPARAENAAGALDIAAGMTRVAEASDDRDKANDPAQGGFMATSTPPSNQTNLGMAPNIAGLLCYVPCCIGFVFSIVAAIVEKQSRFVRFHAFQSLLLNGAAIVLMIGVQILSAVLSSIVGLLGLLLTLVMGLVGLGLLGLSILLMIKANSGEEMELPVIGPMARQWV